jgi:KDO2-lipid IV(A) lauroyltransferase
MFFIVGRQRNPLSEGYLRSVRTATGLEYIARDEKSSRLILRRLKEGKIFGILPDVRMRTAGVPVRLFGHPADLPGGVAAFARHADVPIFLGHVRRVGWTRHVWDFEPPMWIDRNADIEAETTRVYQRIADYFTSIVRRYPDQYFWYNKRWILEPRNY